MHEIAIAESLVELIAEAARRERFRRVRRVRVRLGALGCVEPEALRFCFDIVAEGTVGAGATLDVETVPGEGWCAICRRPVVLAQRYDPCPGCGSHVAMIAGEEMRLAELEVE